MNTKKPLISVVVPIYNVEQYLEKCVDSILEQTYSNLEIILVDDESPDRCGEMCDDYKSRDDRIVVIHKKNGGLSDARNAGIDIAKGEYIFFIDSDDYIDLDTIDFLYSIASSNNSDIATITKDNFYEGKEPQKKKQGSATKELTVDSSEALNRALYENGMTLHAWGKLYRRSLFESIRFPVGKIYEDVGTTYKLFSKANSVTVSPLQKYHYLLRQGSIVRSGFYPAMMDSVYFAEDMVNFAKESQPKSIQATRSYLFMTAIRNLSLVVVSDDKTSYSEHEQKCLEIIKMNRIGVVFDSRTSVITKIYGVAALFGKSIIECALKTKAKLKEIR